MTALCGRAVMPDVSPLCTHRRTYIRNQRLDRAPQLPNHLAMPSLIIQNSHTHETSLMRQRNPTFALTQSEMRWSVRAAFARYALRHLHKPLIASQRRRSGAAAGFRILPDPPFLNFTEEPKMTGMRSGLVILTALLLSGSAAVAQQAGKPCAGDIKTLCVGIQPGEGRIKACIKSHLTDLSPTCNDRVLTVAVTGKVCKTDVTNPLWRCCARHRRYQSLHKIAHGSGERSLQGCDVPGCGRQKNPGRRGPLEIIVRERGPSSEAKAGFDGRLIPDTQN